MIYTPLFTSQTEILANNPQNIKLDGPRNRERNHHSSKFATKAATRTRDEAFPGLRMALRTTK